QIVEVVQEMIGSRAIVPIRPNPVYTYNNTIWEKKEWIILKAHQAGFIDRISSFKKDNTTLYNNSVLAKEKCTKKIGLNLLQSIPVDSKKKLRIQITDLRHLQTRGSEKKQESNPERSEIVTEPQLINVIEKIKKAAEEDTATNIYLMSKALAQLHNVQLLERI
ncbi:29914_t:CDS:2, partial [Gigaspora margarita]